MILLGLFIVSLPDRYYYETINVIIPFEIRAGPLNTKSHSALKINLSEKAPREKGSR